MNKWFWMMNFCKEHQLPPAQSWAWDRAEIAWKLNWKNNHLLRPTAAINTAVPYGKVKAVTFK